MTGKRYSIRQRLVIGTLAAMVLIFGVIGITAHLVAQHESEEIFSARLATSARVLEALAARQLEKATIAHPIVIALPPELEAAMGDAPEEYGHPYETKIAFQVWSERGDLLARSASAPEAALSPLVAGFSTNRINDELWQVFVLHSGSVWVLAAEKDEVRQEMVEDLGSSVIAPLLIGGVLMLFAVIGRTCTQDFQAQAGIPRANRSAGNAHRTCSHRQRIECLAGPGESRLRT
jgi:two-component system sensor histidine kinase QseC